MAGKLYPMKLDFSQQYSSCVQTIDTVLYQATELELSGVRFKMDSIKTLKSKGVPSLSKGVLGRDVLKKAKALRINFATMQVHFE